MNKNNNFLDKLFITEEEYQKRKLNRKQRRVLEQDSKRKNNKLKKTLKYFDNLFISEEEYQAKKKDKSLKKAQAKKEAERIAFESKEIKKFQDQWLETMAFMGIKNILSQTYALVNLKYEPYGFSCNIHAPKGTNLSKLESTDVVATIQDNLKCLFKTKKVPKSNHIEAKFIMKDIPNIEFSPHNLPPYELYLSTGLDGQAMTSNMIKYPHALVQGGTNMGKTKFIDLILVNLITTSSPNDVSLYIIQADKYDQIIYSDVEHCQGYAEDIKDIYCMLRCLLQTVEDRAEEIKPLYKDGICGNIVEYNEAVEKGILKNKSKWNYMYLIIDEYASLMPDNEYDEDNKKIKKAIQSMMDRILQISRAVGLYAILSTQRATIDKMPSFVKAMCATVVTFRVNNRKSSEVAIDSDEAVALKQREFITKIEDTSYGRTVNLPTPAIHKWIKKFRVKKPPFSFDKYNNIEDILDGGKGKKSKNKKTTKRERRENKKNTQETQIKATDPKVLDKALKSIVNQHEKEEEHLKKISDLDSMSNKTSEFFIKDWVDPLSDPNINVKDTTGLYDIVNATKKKKESE